uniref:Uncharacterized protein n=1 Tax=Arundo donax TaxID=35708 RepID=A0A0A8YS31_ARUDO
MHTTPLLTDIMRCCVRGLEIFHGTEFAVEDVYIFPGY